MPFQRKNIRLPQQNYIGRRVYFVTLCTYQRKSYFADLSFGHLVLGHLNSFARRHSFFLHAFCLMPNHLHFLAEGTSPQCNLLPFITAFKQRTSLAHKHRHHGNLWQAKFYDHILRDPEELAPVACYIWANPVRQELCSDFILYSLSGPQSPDWKTLYAHAAPWLPPWKKPMPGSSAPQTGAKPASTTGPTIP